MLNTCTFFSFGNFFVCSDYFFLYSACKDYLIFLGFKKIGHATVWCWLSFFLPMFCFWNSRSVIKVQKNYVIAAFVGRSHIDHLQEDKTIFVCYFYHLFDLILEDVFTIIKGFLFKCVMMVTRIRPKNVFNVIEEV